jgi:hypothetical protein
MSELVNVYQELLIKVGEVDPKIISVGKDFMEPSGEKVHTIHTPSPYSIASERLFPTGPIYEDPMGARLSRLRLIGKEAVYEEEGLPEGRVQRPRDISTRIVLGGKFIKTDHSYTAEERDLVDHPGVTSVSAIRNFVLDKDGFSWVFDSWQTQAFYRSMIRSQNTITFCKRVLIDLPEDFWLDVNRAIR